MRSTDHTRRRRAGLMGVARAARAAARTAAQPITSVRFVGWDMIEIRRLGRRPARRRLTDRPAVTVDTDRLVIRVPDPSGLELLATGHVLRGDVRRVEVRVERMPPWLRGGLRPPRTGRDLRTLGWRSGPDGGVVAWLRWRKRRTVRRALADLSALVLRDRAPAQLGGPLPTDTRAGWLATAEEIWPVGTAVVNPHGRRLRGAATRYRLTAGGDAGTTSSPTLLAADGAPVARFDRRRPVEGVLLATEWEKYAAIEVDGDLLPPGPPGSSAPDRYVAHLLRCLAASGAVLCSPVERIREHLDDLGLSTVPDPDAVADLAGYGLSIAASRRALSGADPVLRRCTDGGPTPTISVLVASKRPEDIAGCLAGLAGQTYPAFEVLVGTHGYRLTDSQKGDFAARLPVPLRVTPIPAENTLGEALGRLSRLADGELVSKVDDDDLYGPDHLTDLVVAARISGADLVAKAARFVYLADADRTIDRTWAAPEGFEVVPAGGTLLLSRGTLQACGGWSTSPRHVDADLLTRVRGVGGITYRTHGLGYVYVRRESGHTWQADADTVAGASEITYPGLPVELTGATGPVMSTAAGL